MAVKPVEKMVKEEKEMRKVLCATLSDLARTNKNIVYLDADLTSAGGMGAFTKEFPDQTFNVGIAEANMIGVACGLSATGKIPFAHSFGTFASRRCYDQIFLSGGYAKSNLKVIGSDPGVTAAFNGGTHMPFEDVGIMRNIPTATVIEPTDSVMLQNLIPQIAAHFGVDYIRLKRKNAVAIYEEGTQFTIGKAVKLAEGNDVTIIASGIMVELACKAAAELKNSGINARVLDMFTIKPIDSEAIISAANETGCIVTCENHNVINGLSSAVADVVVRNCPVPMEFVGIEDEFGEVGPETYLRERFKLTTENIIDKVKKAITRK
ncbi:MAG: transketolase C-terminal domain-containing protein [Oscillospiraceae bacterium]